MAKIIIKTAEQLEIITANGKILAGAHALVASTLKAGVKGLTLDKLAEEYIRDNGGSPSFKGYNKFPASLCISINEVVVHGIPHAIALKEGDMISVDGGVFKDGFHADSAYSYALLGCKEEVVKLMKVTKESLYIGMAQAKAGNRTGDIGAAIQEYCERKNAYKCVRELVGHGVGANLHEDPQVPNYGKAGKGDILPENAVIAIEPMINLGRKDIYTLPDNWTIATQDNKPSAHFEHSLVVTKEGGRALTTFEPIEAAVKANTNLIFV
jgi:methionyl aminopeptidase